MTEAEWRTSCRPVRLLDFASARLTVRQQRLIAVASCRTISPAVLGLNGERWLATADKLAEQPDVEVTPTTVRRWMRAFGREGEVRLAHPNLPAVFYQVGLGDPRTTMVNVGYVKGTTRPNYDVVDEEIAGIVRDVVGDPSRTVGGDRSWFTSTVVALAQQIYELREFGAMPILADALQDVGCDNEDVLSHCRGPGPHVRGCWVIDILTGRK